MNKKWLETIFSRYILSIILIVVFIVSSSEVAFANERVTVDKDVPDTLVAGLNIATDDSKGKKTRAIFFINPDTEDVWIFPLTDVPGGPVLGQGMHTAIAPDKKSFYITMGGNESLPLRLEKFDIDWKKGKPSIKLASEQELVAADTESIFGWGSDEPSKIQEAHGLNIDPTQKYLMWSNLNNHSVQVFSLEDNKLLTGAITDKSVYTPHGLFANPNGNLAVTPNYAYGNQTATVWNIKDGVPSFRNVVKLTSSDVEGAWPHMAEWIDDQKFLLPSGHEPIDKPVNTYEAGLWLCDASRDNCRNLIRQTTLDNPEAGVIKGVSDVVWRKTDNGIRAYVGEGNFLQKDEQGNPVKGYISIWDFNPNDNKPAKFVKRFSPGENGLPASYRDTHGMCQTGKYAYTMSFASDSLIEIDMDSDTISHVYGRDDGLIVPHGVSCSS